MAWTSGDRILLYTDGLSEARDRRGEFLPLLPLAPLLRGPFVEDSLDDVLTQVRRHVSAGRLADDLAVLLLENAVPGEVAPGPRDSLSTSPEPPARVAVPVDPPVSGRHVAAGRRGGAGRGGPGGDRRLVQVGRSTVSAPRPTSR